MTVPASSRAALAAFLAGAVLLGVVGLASVLARGAPFDGVAYPAAGHAWWAGLDAYGEGQLSSGRVLGLVNDDRWMPYLGPPWLLPPFALLAPLGLAGLAVPLVASTVGLGWLARRLDPAYALLAGALVGFSLGVLQLVPALVLLSLLAVRGSRWAAVATLALKPTWALPLVCVWLARRVEAPRELVVGVGAFGVATLSLLVFGSYVVGVSFADWRAAVHAIQVIGPEAFDPWVWGQWGTVRWLPEVMQPVAALLGMAAVAVAGPRLPARLRASFGLIVGGALTPWLWVYDALGLVALAVLVDGPEASPERSR